MEEREQYIKELISRDTAKRVMWETSNYIGRICPTCGHKSYYCNRRNEDTTRQPDNFCSKCGQRFVVE